ncbi:hypothetical protein [Hymenobacter sp. UYCo722]|uniref:hypothetical protein n=1 Tax=Hymenobacter sp. UYCo722 TaxID=3156335 RepID=UPI003398A4D3
MKVVQQANGVSLVVSVLYVGAGTLQLLASNGGDGIFRLGGALDDFLGPGYFLGFALGYGGGTFWAMAGQAVMLLVVYGIALSIFLPIFKLIEKGSSSSKDT